MRTFLALLAGLALTAQAGITSSYTNMETDCGDAIDESSVPAGTDIPQKCKGPGGYRVNETYAVFGSFRHITRASDDAMIAPNLSPDDCPIPAFGKMVEWRLRNGKPFAVIQRASCYSMEDAGVGGRGKQLGEWLVVQELQGAKRKQQVDASKPNANIKAREIADKF
ncbi:MAG: hypothetical protein IPO40_00775 [Fibrobacteres bacterium]|nr:hypothetical protein [Fibrobacterota bacterium]